MSENFMDKIKTVTYEGFKIPKLKIRNPLKRNKGQTILGVRTNIQPLKMPILKAPQIKMPVLKWNPAQDLMNIQKQAFETLVTKPIETVAQSAGQLVQSVTPAVSQVVDSATGIVSRVGSVAQQGQQLNDAYQQISDDPSYALDQMTESYSTDSYNTDLNNTEKPVNDVYEDIDTELPVYDPSNDLQGWGFIEYIPAGLSILNTLSKNKSGSSNQLVSNLTAKINTANNRNEALKKAISKMKSDSLILQKQAYEKGLSKAADRSMTLSNTENLFAPVKPVASIANLVPQLLKRPVGIIIIFTVLFLAFYYIKKSGRR